MSNEQKKIETEKEPEKYEEIIKGTNFLTEREKDLAEQFVVNMFNRGLFDDEMQQTIVTTELVLAIYHHRKSVYEEISDLLLNYSMNWKKLDANDLVNKI